jgi:hypothetical protein
MMATLISPDSLFCSLSYSEPIRPRITGLALKHKINGGPVAHLCTTLKSLRDAQDVFSHFDDFSNCPS